MALREHKTDAARATYDDATHVLIVEGALVDGKREHLFSVRAREGDARDIVAALSASWDERAKHSYVEYAGPTRELRDVALIVRIGSRGELTNALEAALAAIDATPATPVVRPSVDAAPLTTDERAELERLRALTGNPQ